MPMTTGRAHFTGRGIERGGQDRFQKPTKTNSKKSYAAIRMTFSISIDQDTLEHTAAASPPVVPRIPGIPPRALDEHDRK